MRYLSMLVVIALVFVFALTVASIAAAATLTPRPLDPLAASTLELAIARSATVRSLITRLESSNVIVHIETSKLMPLGIGGMTRFVTSRGGYRYLRITISALLIDGARTAILGHELQHACEVAASTADDAASIRELFENEGHRAGDYFETDAARLVERDIRAELWAGGLRVAALPGR